MFKNKFIKLLTATAFAVVGISTVNINSNTSTVQAAYAHNVSRFHYLNKKHTYKTLGFSDGFPFILKANGKFYIDDDKLNITSTVTGPAKTNGYRYIDGTKYYYIPVKNATFDSEYVAAKYFTKKYNDMSYLTVYRVNSKIKALSDDMDNTDDGMWYGKGDIILVNNFSLWNHDKYVDTISPMQDGKHNADGWYAPDGSGIGGELTHEDFKNHCSKASANTKYLLNHGEDWYTNSSLARGGMYHKGHFYKVYSR